MTKLLNDYKSINEIVEYLLNNINIFNPRYQWVTKSGAGYEKEFCELLNWKFVDKRHWDCEYKDYKIELKKTKSNGIQIDEIRYAEEIVLDNYECNQNIITIFIEVYPDKSKKKGVKRLYVARNEEVIKLLNFPNKEYCKLLVERQQNLNTSLSFTHRLKYIDIKKLSVCIPFDKLIK